MMTVTLHVEGYRSKKEAVADLKDAAECAKYFLWNRGLGASHMGTKHGIVSENGVVIAKVSYNGRVWHPTTGEEIVP